MGVKGGMKSVCFAYGNILINVVFSLGKSWGNRAL
jgi:hypothetical protein